MYIHIYIYIYIDVLTHIPLHVLFCDDILDCSVCGHVMAIA